MVLYINSNNSIMNTVKAFGIWDKSPLPNAIAFPETYHFILVNKLIAK